MPSTSSPVVPNSNVDNTQDSTAPVTASPTPAPVDILLYSGLIDYAGYSSLVKTCETTKNENVVLILNTVGGNPDAAYKIAKHLQHRYKKFTLLIACFCKSAGTLIAIGANELIFAEGGELGPLDVQLRKDHELGGEFTSGLDVMSALDTLNTKTLEMFTEFLTEIRFGGQLSTDVASEMATSVVTALYRSLYKQIDPMTLGNIARSMTIAQSYGIRLDQKGGNLKSGALARLISDYPSHSFVIDYEEARELFKKVRKCNAIEANFAALVTQTHLDKIGQTPPFVACLNPTPPQAAGNSGAIPTDNTDRSHDSVTSVDGGNHAQSQPARQESDTGSRTDSSDANTETPPQEKSNSGSPDSIATPVVGVTDASRAP